MLNPSLFIAWTWWQWSLAGAGAFFTIFLLFLAIANRRPRRPPSRGWKRYSGDSRYL